MFNAADYLDKLSMHGPAGNLSESESRAVWTELRRRMNEPEPPTTEALEVNGGKDGTQEI